MTHGLGHTSRDDQQQGEADTDQGGDIAGLHVGAETGTGLRAPEL